MPVLEFEFYLEENVLTPFGDQGIISMLGYDESGCVYYVKTSTSEMWFKEKQIKKMETKLR